MKRYACYCMTRNIYHKVIPSLRSLLAHADLDEVYLITEDDDVGFALPEKVRIINVSDQTFFPPDGANTNCRWTYMALMRVALCHVLPWADRVLALDLDTIVTEDINDLWKAPIDNHYMAGCREPAKSQYGLYINGGVVLWNLKKMRDGKADEIIRALNERKYAFPEQDCMNALCRGHIYELGGEYNSSSVTVNRHIARIVHFAATRGWYEKEPLVQMYKGDFADDEQG